MGYDSTDPVKAKFLRDEWTKANTLGGKAADVYEESTAVPEGRTRMGILPFTKPEGVTGKEAILSGQTELAFPGLITGVGEEISKAVTTGEKMTSGISTTQEELEQAGTTVGELAMGASAFNRVPEGSLRIFGGFSKAVAPGKKSTGENLFPTLITIGADKKKRFEIDDSQAEFKPYNVKYLSGKKITNNDILAYDSYRKGTGPTVGLKFSPLEDILDHEELFYQYPALKDIKVIVDEDLEGTNTLGYFERGNNLIAVAPSVAKNTDQFRKTLIHEVQHKVQELEGFTSGTNLFTKEVADYAKNIVKPEREAKEELAYEKYLDDLRAFKSFDYSRPFLKFNSFLSEVAENRGLPFKDYISMTHNDVNPWGETEELWQLLYHKEKVLELEDKITRAIDPSEEARKDLGPLIQYVLKNLKLNETEKELFKEYYGKTFDRNKRSSEFLSDLGFMAEPKKPSKSSFASVLDASEAYRRKRGETEARNVSSRLDFTEFERTKRLPSSTEDYPRDKQWGDPGFAKGGLAMDDQMYKLFMARGGLKDDGMNMDPISGNEVPPGSLAQEVRDDIPAQLSDGEYVVPADVVRYYGVKFFEDLRQEAKSGLSGMEKDGRIGGEPAPDMPSDMPAGLGGEMPEGDNMPEGDITPEMFEALMAQAGRGQAPLRMATGGVATVSNNPFNLLGSQTDLLGNTITTGSYTTGQTAEEPTGDTAKIESQRTFPNQTGMPGYSAQTMGIVGSPTIAQIGTGIPAYVYRYIDPLTGKLIDVKPGETPPPGAIPVETVPVEQEEYDEDNNWQKPEEKPYDPTNVRGMNYNDPVAGAQASYDSAFGSGGVLGVASKAPGIIGFAAGGIQELNRINAISQINGQLSLTEARFGKDSAEAAKVRSLLDDALEKAKLDNILPENWYNGTGRVNGAYKDYKKNGGTLSYADWLSGGAAVSPTSKPTGKTPATSTVTPKRGGTSSDVSKGPRTTALQTKFEEDRQNRRDDAESRAADISRAAESSGRTVAEVARERAPSTSRDRNIGSGRGGTAMSSDPVSAQDAFDPRNMNKGGLMKRKSPVKRK